MWAPYCNEHQDYFQIPNFQILCSSMDANPVNVSEPAFSLKLRSYMHTPGKTLYHTKFVHNLSNKNMCKRI